MRYIRTISLFLLFCLIVLSPVLSDTSPRGEVLLDKGKIRFKNSQFNEALMSFREIILDSELSPYHGDAYFWIAKTYMATGEFDKAEKNLEFFLMNYKDNQHYPESYYQKGRLLYLQQEYEKAIQVLNNFIDFYGDNPFVANAYYWIGESLYALGHFDKAEKIFTYIVQHYPSSYKIEAAKYRISIIHLKYREQELLKFLKWSHEEALNALEEFQIREKTYEQALAAYQKKLTEYAESGIEAKLEELKIDLNEKEAEIESLRETIQSLKNQLTNVNQQLEETKNKLKQNMAQQGTDQRTTSAVGGEQDQRSTDDIRNLLEIKEEALALEQFYLNWLKEHMEK